MLCAGRPSARTHLAGPTYSAFLFLLTHCGLRSYPFASMTSMRNYGTEVATAMPASFAHATSHRCTVELHACVTEPASLHDGCYSKQTRGGALCDAAPPASCRRPPRRRASIRPSEAHIVRVCFKCFTSFIWMLQVFHLDVTKVDLNVAKVDRNVALVAVAIHICFKCMFQMFHLVFQTYVCKCFVSILHMFSHI